MITLERLLDGLHVEVEPCPPPPSPAHVRWTAMESMRGRSAVLELVGGTTMRFSAHRVIILPPRSRPRSAADDHAPRPAGGDADVVVDCGRIRAVYQESLGLFDHLREPLVETLAADDPIRQAFEQLLDEIASHRPGFRAMAETLVRQCLILLLRRCFEHGAGRLSWLAIEDTRLGRAVTAMQDRPEHSFTLTELAEVAGMSRSVFAARFAGAAGQSPMEFLKALRLRRAAEFLTRTDLPVKSVSARVGYSSRSAFTRAFVACHGVGPTAFRAAARDGAVQVA